MTRSLLYLRLGSVLILAGLAAAVNIYGSQRSLTIPAGTEVKVRIDKQLDTGTAQPGDKFSGTLTDPVTVGGRTALFRGAKVNGRVVDATSSGRLKKPASITLELTSVSTEPLRIDGKSHLVRNAEMIGGGAAAGALIGALVGGKKGAAIGAGVGAGAGTAGAYMTGKQEIVLPAETPLTFVVGSATGVVGGQPMASRTARPAPGADSRQPSAYPAAGDESGPSGGSYAQPVFSSRDQQIIRSYYGGSTSNLPPGLAKRGGRLPPGLERQLERNGTLPPGLQKRVEPFPSDLSRQLPQLPSGYSRVVVEGRALILDRNNKILDLMVLVR